ncbi:phosphoglycerate mutase [Diaporthe helianthi]|uniref:Phosphoglycerate mutase n=1 Tax=Diaporthe helianthi TaxID=158607 RepID=A0A2P5HUS3_DIAHE|nr:phosphoglycerate mutase [Diaporthe helianthi]
MRLFLIRHGESVDNVAGLYAGSRDSSLTNHGVLQARRLGGHLVSRSSTIGRVQRIFTSNLQRAVRTAEAVAEAQTSDDPSAEVVSVIQLPELREKNFGSDEGRKFGTRGTDQSYAGWIEPESKESMKARVERFIDNHLIPTVLRGFHSDVNHSLAIVAHGIILNVLLRCLLARFGPDEMTKLTRPTDTPGKMEWLASWSNTGYLEADLRLRLNAPQAGPRPSPPATPGNSRPMLGSVVPRQASRENAVAAADTRPAEAPNVEILMTVTSVNNTDHLQGLKKTRGGIGSAAFDQKQKTMDSFFITRTPKASPPVKAPSPVKAPLPVKDTTPVEPPQPVELSPPAEAPQKVQGPRPQPPARQQTQARPQPQPQPQVQVQVQPQPQPQPLKATQPAQPPPPTKATQPVQPVQPSPAVQAVQAPRPIRSPKPAASSRRAQVTRPIKAAEPATEPPEQVKSPPPAEALQPVKAPQPTEATRPAKAPQPVKVSRPATEVSVASKATESSSKVTQSTKVLRANKVKRPIKKTKPFKKVRFILPVKD